MSMLPFASNEYCNMRGYFRKTAVQSSFHQSIGSNFIEFLAALVLCFVLVYFTPNPL